jgi:hypothetical protein
MQHRLGNLEIFGTLEPPPPPVWLTTGPLAAQIVDGAVQQLCWYGTQVIRAVDCIVRDATWATCAFSVANITFEANESQFRFQCDRLVANGAVTCRLAFCGDSSGVFRASAAVTAESNFSVNRAGFVVLHGADLSGESLQITHIDGSAEILKFPSLISPGQISSDITALEYDCRGVCTSVRFLGETFEMEDQRNWGDASYKTYCRPLSKPIPYVLCAGQTFTQEVEVRVSGTPATAIRGNNKTATQRLDVRSSGEKVPGITLALEGPLTLNDREIRIIRSAGLRAVQVRLHRENTATAVAEVRRYLGGLPTQIELEIVVPAGQQIESWLSGIASHSRACGLDIARVIALPEAYLKSYQPGGPWPAGPTPRDACIAARRAFPAAQIGCGVLTNFTELNRCRPDTSVCDYVSHGFSALVHASDDRSVLESLQGLSHVLASGKALSEGCDYRLGLVSIGMRSNPYGPNVAANPHQVRVPMARCDPRHRGMFAAAWAVGAVAATEGYGVASLSLTSPVGPFGMICRSIDGQMAVHNCRGDMAVYPLFHVITALGELEQSPRLSVLGLPPELKVVAAETSKGCLLVCTNLSPDSLGVELPRRGAIRRLDQRTYDLAVREPDWLITTETEHRTDVRLAPFDVAFVRMEGGFLG